MNALPIYDDRYIKTKIRTYGNQVYTNFRGLNVSENDIECEPFIVISIDSLLVYENKYYRFFTCLILVYKYYLQVYLDNCSYKIVDKRMIDYLGDNIFETDEK